MIINCRNWRKSRKVLLDGVEIPQVWYVDRRRRVLKPYGLNADGSFRMVNNDVETLEWRWRPRQVLRLEAL